MSWRSIQLDRRLSRTLGEGFLLEFLEAALKGDPDNIEILVQLADLYSKFGRLRDALAVDLKLVSLCPQEKIFHYNLACTYSRLNDIDSALLALEKALLLGFDDWDQIKSDSDLANLRKDPRFKQLVRVHFNREAHF